MNGEHFDAVIIGSGFGGSVMAYKLAAAGLRVCLLERGKPYPPNSFARAPHKMRRNFWDPSKGLYGLFNVWSFTGSGALVSAGLGGGSLIYANIIIRKDDKWFVKEDLQHGGYEYWPVTRADLDPHYDRVDRMMNVQKYPLDHPPYDKTQKTLAMREAAQKLNLDWKLLNLAVSFRRQHVADPNNPDDQGNPALVGEPIQEQFRNIHNMTRYTCLLCGECDIGCNSGSKNTLDYTYITAAVNQKPNPAEVRPLCEVKSFSPLGGKGYEVKYLQHDLRYEGVVFGDGELEKTLGTTTITCDRLILAAGTFGTPYLLFKNRQAFPNISPKLGSRFSVNGDLLSFIVNAKEKKNGKTEPRLLDPSFGPVITSAIRLGDTLDGMGEQGRGFYVEDGGNPSLLSWAVELTNFCGILRRAYLFGKRFVSYRIGLNKDADLDDEIANLIGDCTTSKSSMPVLTMGRDYPNGNLKLDCDGYLECDWTPKRSQEYYNRVVRVVSSIARSLNAEYMDNPSYQYLHQVLTAHPLGGCPMGMSKDEGVTDSYGEVFDYSGLYVADGSVMPGPVGPNPSMTIAAISDRAADHIIDQHNGAAR